MPFPVQLASPPLRFEMACLFEYATIPITPQTLLDLATTDEAQSPKWKSSLPFRRNMGGESLN